VIACPFGVPRWFPEIDQMMKCDLCYDRTSEGKRPMCVTVCPSGALYFGTRSEVEAKRRERPANAFAMGGGTVRTRVQLMMPGAGPAAEVDVADLMEAGR
jgi:Fe-S-cluster-containing dehydrogenase component